MKVFFFSTIEETLQPRHTERRHALRCLCIDIDVERERE